jgi:hypothetical protein
VAQRVLLDLDLAQCCTKNPSALSAQKASFPLFIIRRSSFDLKFEIAAVYPASYLSLFIGQRGNPHSAPTRSLKFLTCLLAGEYSVAIFLEISDQKISAVGKDAHELSPKWRGNSNKSNKEGLLTNGD